MCVGKVGGRWVREDGDWINIQMTFWVQQQLTTAKMRSLQKCVNEISAERRDEGDGGGGNCSLSELSPGGSGGGEVKGGGIAPD